MADGPARDTAVQSRIAAVADTWVPGTVGELGPPYTEDIRALTGESGLTKVGAGV